MAKEFYVYSTMSQDVSYPIWSDGEVKRVVEHIVINGGTGVVDKRLYTPNGVVTKVTQEQLAHLKNDRVFKLHEKNGFVKVSEENVNPEKVATEGMELRDQSAQLVPEDFENAPKTKTSKKAKDE